MIITVRNLAEIEDSNRGLDTEIRDHLTIKNPKWIENQRMGRWPGKTPKHLMFYEEVDGRLFVPRGAINTIMEMCIARDVSIDIIDETILLPNVDLGFKGILRPGDQTPAVMDILADEEGTLCAPTGSGKTVMALWIIAARKQPTMIITHTRELLYQWINRINTFLRIPKRDIGIIGDGQKRIGKKITIALIQSLRKMKNIPGIGLLVVDECHRIPGTTFYKTVKKFNCRYLLGLSATPFRRDGLTKLIFWYTGPIRHKIDTIDLMQQGHIARIEPIIRRTNFVSLLDDPSEEYTKLLSEISKDNNRNKLIITDVIKEARRGEICLVLTDRKEHCRILKDLLSYKGLAVELLTGDVKYRDQIIKDINNGKINILVATSQLIGEGFDCKNLSALFLTIPIGSEGRLIQYIGRVLRPRPGKDRAKIYDYLDQFVKCCYGSYKTRLKTYKKLEV